VLSLTYRVKLSVAVIVKPGQAMTRLSVAAMQQIGDWLKKLGMSEYAQRFVENRIDLSVLPDLMDQDLEKMGVSLGDHRKMLRAIRDLGSTSIAVAAPSAAAETEPARQGDAERRQLRTDGTNKYNILY